MAWVARREATVKDCGVTVGEAAGAKLGTDLSIDRVVNVGTAHSRPPYQASNLMAGRPVAG